MFIEKLNTAWREKNSLVCAGLDPDPDKLPASLTGKDRLFQFNREIIDATAPWVCAFKPQIAYYAAVAAEDQLTKTIDYIRINYPATLIILDAKRGDIGATAKMYAREAFDRYQADAVTVNPYMGGDTLQPFLDYADRGVIILCRTSNPGSGDIQQLAVSGGSVASQVAKLAVSRWNKHNNIGLVVGATYPEEVASVRKLVGAMPLLVPGVGAQGGDLKKVLSAGLDQTGQGLIINASRSIIYASAGVDFASAAADAAQSLCRQINSLRNQLFQSES
jgi:orotidine-5'-phosphate decarboxylase